MNLRSRVSRLASRLEELLPATRHFRSWMPWEAPPVLPPNATETDRHYHEQLLAMDRTIGGATEEATR